MDFPFSVLPYACRIGASEQNIAVTSNFPLVGLLYHLWLRYQMA